MKITIFSWGYYGWGNHARKLVKAVDAVEEGRGFKPPLFVDIRIRRSVRAKGFAGTAFEKLLGRDRHEQKQSLGNVFIKTNTGPHIQIKDPKAADELLELAIDSARRKQRILFFCSCPWPKCDGKVACHRTTVARLVLKAAQRRGKKVEIVEWPGGSPRHINIDVKPKLFSAIKNGNWHIPREKACSLAEVAGLPWCSTATIRSGDDKLHRIVGPAVRLGGKWSTQIMYQYEDPTIPLETYRKKVPTLRKSWGFEPRSTE